MVQPVILHINVKHSKKALEGILTVKTGIDQITFFILPFGKSAAVECLFSVLDDERHNAIVKQRQLVGRTGAQSGRISPTVTMLPARVGIVGIFGKRENHFLYC